MLSPLKKNLIASYLSQGYIAGIGIFVLPFYIKYMGAEAFGLIGFFSLIQVLFTLLDVGLSPLMIRQTALFRGGGVSALELRRLLRSLEGIFFSMSGLGMLISFLCAEYMASRWLNVEYLSNSEVINSVSLIGLIVGLRWIGVLYKGVISGHEELVWLGSFNSLIATGRFILVLPVLVYYDASPSTYFSYQLALALIEVIILVIFTYSILPGFKNNEQVTWSFEPLKSNLMFSGGIAFTNATWIAFSQVDKLVISKILSLADYGFFTLGVLLASSVMVLSSPIAMVLLPRLSKLHALGDDDALMTLYRQSAQVVATIAIPAAVTMAFCAKQILLSWTGDVELAESAAPVLALYALGNAVMAISAFPYYFQFAKGDIKLHIIGSTIFIFILVPAVIWAAMTHGIVGPGYAWLGVHLLSFIFWVPVVHRRFSKSLHREWMSDITPIICSPILFVFLLQSVLVWPEARLMVVITILLSFSGALFSAALSSSFIRVLAKNTLT